MKCVKCKKAGAYYRVRTDDWFCRQCKHAEPDKNIKEENKKN